jgi:hypothetical protein
LRQIVFLVNRESGEAVIRRIAQYHQDWFGLFYAFGCVAFLQKFGKPQQHLRL